MTSSWCVIDNNTVITNGDGISLTQTSTNNLLTNNTALDNAANGFWLDSTSSNNTLIGNNALKGIYGYYVASSYNLLINNLEENNGYYTDNPVLYTPMATYYNSASLLLNYISPTTGKTVYFEGIMDNAFTNGTYLPSLADGTYNFTIQIVASTNVYIQRVLFAIDTTNPQVAITSPTTGNYSTNSVQVNYTVTESNPYKTVLLLDGTANTTNIQSGTVFQNLSNGQHNLTIVATDLAGNIAMKTVSFTIEYNTTTTTPTNTNMSSSATSTSSTGSTSQTNTNPIPGFTIYTLLASIAILIMPILKRRKR